MKERFVKKYMRLAKQVGEDGNPCLSRAIGVVLVDPILNKILGTGYNGPPRDTPHADNREYLERVVWPQLTDAEKDKVCGEHRHDLIDDDQCQHFCDTWADKRQCPRKIVGAASGKRLELCPCAHAETNAIVNASTNLYGAYAFCWCGCPCTECTKLMINAGIKRVYTIDWGADYSHGSRFQFAKAGVEIIEHKPEYYLDLGN